LEECAELRITLKTISSQLGRMEARVKHAFPDVAKQVRERRSHSDPDDGPPMSSEQAQAEFDAIVKLAASGNSEQAERKLRDKSASDLLAIAKELGVSFAGGKPSIKAAREAIFGKVRESIQLSKHSPRAKQP
jgi:hypothetical protein